MSFAFYPPSMRASSGDLTVAVSPLGLVELADEEFEVHGPRLTRYSTAWAWYLGHHYGYRREVGEPQFSFNYIRAFSDYITNFCFSKGFSIEVPPANEAITPTLLKRVWEEDNAKERILWEIGQTGSVCGDVFMKVAYEDPYVDSIGRLVPGRVRLIPINPSHAFPEFHPHDRQRLLRMKIKYRFWATNADGTRGVNTYTEIISETGIEEYVNNELIDARPNPIGSIPVVHCANIQVAGSPWGLSDIMDIIPLNREFNEKALELSDIINYHSAPVTVVIGAKASQLEKGPRKTWSLPKDARVENLQAIEELQGPLGYMEMLKRAMHELTGVPEAALGQQQPISNTSGVALHIQYQPLMNRWAQKKVQYTTFLREVNRLILMTLAHKEPWVFQYNPGETAMPEDGEQIVLDINDPDTYETSIHWPSPLPVDVLITLNEIQALMALGLESKKGALKRLGEEFPEEKRNEIFNELIQDAKEQGALDMLRSAIGMAVFLSTGVPPEGVDGGGGGGGSVVSTGDTESPGGDTGTPAIQVPAEVQQLAAELVTRAYGTKLAQRRNPSNSEA